MLEAIRKRATLAVILLGMIVLAVRLSGTHMHWSIDAPTDSPMHEWAHHANGDHHVQHIAVMGPVAIHAHDGAHDHGHHHDPIGESHGHAHGEVDAEVQALSSSGTKPSVSLLSDAALVFCFLLLILLVRAANQPAPRPPDGPPLRRLLSSPLKTGPPRSSLD